MTLKKAYPQHTQNCTHYDAATCLYTNGSQYQINGYGCVNKMQNI